MRYRFARSSDLQALSLLLRPAFQTGTSPRPALPELWETLRARDEIRITLVEDPEHPLDGVCAWAASVFVRDEFAQEFRSRPRPGLASEVYQRITEGDSPLASPGLVRSGNAGDGLNLVMLHFVLNNPDLSDPQVQQLMIAVNAAFFFFYGGYRLKTILQEVYGAQAAAYMRAGGFHLLDDFGAMDSRRPEDPIDGHPYLFGLRAEEAVPGAVNPISLLFYPARPRISFSTKEQAVLELALLNESDTEISHDLGVSLDAVKKTWRRIYERAARTLPYMAGDETFRPSGARGSEKRRHVLDYIRIHLEELRPH